MRILNGNLLVLNTNEMPLLYLLKELVVVMSVAVAWLVVCLCSMPVYVVVGLSHVQLAKSVH